MKKRSSSNIILGLLLLFLFLGCYNFNAAQKSYQDILNPDIIPKGNNSDINILTPQNKTYSTKTGNFLNSYDFDDVSPYVEYYGQINDLDGHRNILKIGYGNGYMIENQFNRTYGTIEFYLRTEDASDRSVISFEGDDVISHIYLYTLNDEWYYLDWDSRISKLINLTDDYKPSDNKWHHIRIDFECTTGGYNGLSQETWKLTVDGHTSNDLKVFKSQISPPPCFIKQIYLFSEVNQPNGATYFDAFGYSWDSFYSIGDNLNEGLALFFEISFEMDWATYSLDYQAPVEIPGNKTIPFPINGSHSIRITANDTVGTIYQSTLRYFVLSAIIITYPEKDTIWEEGEEYEIVWFSYHNITHVDIQFYKGDVLNYEYTNLENNGTFLWTVPDSINIGLDWKIKISDTSNSLVYAVSEFFEIVSAIVVLAPDYSSVWSTGRRYEISWSSKGNISYINILFRKGGILQFSKNDFPNNKSYLWDIKHNVSAGTDWSIRIEDANDTSIYGDSDNFEISNQTLIQITSPTTLTSWERGTEHYITWYSTGNISYVDIEFFLGGSPKYLISGTENDGAKYWHISLEEEAGIDWEIKITASDNSSIYDYSGNFEIYERNILEISTPHIKTRWLANTSQTIYWTESAGSEVEYVNLEFFKGTNPIPIYSYIGIESDGEFQWMMPFDPPPGDNWYIKISDTYNSSIYAYSENFEIYTYKSINILSPTSISDWTIPGEEFIRWTWHGDIQYVDIEIYKSTELRFGIYELENNGSYSHYLPYFEDPGIDWNVRISASDYLSIYDEILNFEAHIKRTITVLDPTAGKAVYRNEYYDIVWTTNGTISNVRIDLFEDGIFVKTITESTENDGRYLWHIISISKSKTYQIKISDADIPSVFELSEEFEVTDRTLVPGYDLIYLISLMSIIIISVCKTKLKKKIKLI